MRDGTRYAKRLRALSNNGQNDAIFNRDAWILEDGSVSRGIARLKTGTSVPMTGWSRYRIVGRLPPTRFHARCEALFSQHGGGTIVPGWHGGLGLLSAAEGATFWVLVHSRLREFDTGSHPLGAISPPDSQN